MGSGIQAVDKVNELLSNMSVCTNGLHNGIIAYVLQIGERTIHRIYVPWMVSMEAIFSHINLKPDYGFLPCSKAEVFIKTGPDSQML